MYIDYNVVRKMLEGSLPEWHRAYEVQCLPGVDGEQKMCALYVRVVIDKKTHTRAKVCNVMLETQPSLEKWIRDSLYDITIDTDDIPF